MRSSPGVRLLPNAITVLAMCAGLSAVQFALNQQLTGAIAAVAVAAVLDGLDGRIARLLDATTKMGAELDSLSDAMSFGVAPALTLYVWHLQGNRLGWVVALVFAVCMVLRLARFNTLLDDDEQPPFTKEFFVGVPAPAAGLLALLPLLLTAQFGQGWWSNQTVLMLWILAIAALAVSRVPTLSLKTVKVPPRMVAPLLVLVALLAAGVIVFPRISLAVALVVYLAHVPYAVYRYSWLAQHPEAWSAPPRERRAIRRTQRRLGLRPPLRRSVAGAARRVRLARRNGQRNRQGKRTLGIRRER
ncbi:CDP-diacylglycerol--serine O-phosphatidyltransferase [Allosaccharopolyspora coralli]|uniref:CDP-diacylglycerol--serine O-phosphatidyltransferase n=1 Tax=Allosaccharopolyspora coralli TaxID=2665642 RepID=A0A5Q3QKM8_9PSEU|nr:CDP-diacylglycerol--serine O-phosphatidyltransferase [Allosaccharopolyspora coralli]QGK71979.1 CDP-diacylglycerol--serine O-phosphatidyltransferase [Allosaccharopolyspora coralli]